MKKTHLLLFAFVMILSAQAQTVKVAAAANLRFVFDEIKASYAIANPKATITANFGSSGALLQQILNGAEFDVFMAADNSFPVKLKDQGAASGEIKTMHWEN